MGVPDSVKIVRHKMPPTQEITAIQVATVVMTHQAAMVEMRTMAALLAATLLVITMHTAAAIKAFVATLPLVICYAACAYLKPAVTEVACAEQNI